MIVPNGRVGFVLRSKKGVSPDDQFYQTYAVHGVSGRSGADPEDAIKIMEVNLGFGVD